MRKMPGVLWMAPIPSPVCSSHFLALWICESAVLPSSNQPRSNLWKLLSIFIALSRDSATGELSPHYKWCLWGTHHASTQEKIIFIHIEFSCHLQDLGTHLETEEELVPFKQSPTRVPGKTRNNINITSPKWPYHAACSMDYTTHFWNMCEILKVMH